MLTHEDKTRTTAFNVDDHDRLISPYLTIPTFTLVVFIFLTMKAKQLNFNSSSSNQEEQRVADPLIEVRIQKLLPTETHRNGCEPDQTADTFLQRPHALTGLLAYPWYRSAPVQSGRCN